MQYRPKSLHLECHAAAARIGAAVALMNVQLKPSEFHELVKAAGCAAVGVAGDPFRAALEP